MNNNSTTVSPRQKIAIIFNPTSGNKSGKRKLNSVIKELHQFKIQIKIFETKAPGDAVFLANEAITNDFDIIAVAGGDGTINEVANAVVGTQIPIALIPTGTINLLARELNLRRDPKTLARNIVYGPSRPALPCCVGKRLFLIVASIGFDARVIDDVSLKLKGIIGQWAYIFAGIARWVQNPVCQLKLEYKKERHSISGLIATNGLYYGGHFTLPTKSSIFNPNLDLHLFTGENRWALSHLIITILLGRMNNLKHIEITLTESVTISSPQREPVQADGDIIAHTPITISRSKYPVYLIGPI
jgi:YegS/Rv2252/BmrU family lipid kinase